MTASPITRAAMAASFRRQNVRVLGEGPLTLLLVHGYGCNQAMWRRMAPALAQRWKVVLLDLVGFGGSDFGAWDAVRHASLEGYAQDIAELAGHLRDRPLVHVGHSVGAMLGVLAEVADPSLFAAHVMVAPSPCFLNDGDYRGGFERSALEALLASQAAGMPQWAELVAGLVMKQPGTDDLTLELARSFCQALPEAATALARATFLGDQRQVLGAVRKPALILQSAEDDLADPAIGAYLQARIAGSRLEVLQAWGHCPHLVTPELCLQAMDGFLDALPPGRG